MTVPALNVDGDRDRVTRMAARSLERPLDETGGCHANGTLAEMRQAAEVAGQTAASCSKFRAKDYPDGAARQAAKSMCPAFGSLQGRAAHEAGGH